MQHRFWKHSSLLYLIFNLPQLRLYQARFCLHVEKRFNNILQSANSILQTNALAYFANADIPAIIRMKTLLATGLQYFLLATNSLKRISFLFPKPTITQSKQNKRLVCQNPEYIIMILLKISSRQTFMRNAPAY
jgi:hypothetical protein